MLDQYNQTVADITGNNLIGPYSQGGPWSGSFILTKPTMVFAKMPITQYYPSNTHLIMTLTRTAPSSSSAPAAVTDVYAVVMADSFNSASDARLKKDIVTLEGALDKIDTIHGVHYHWIDEEQSKSRQVGVIAQEIQEVYPELVMEGGNGYLSVDYPKLTAVLIQSVKELKALIMSLENE